MPRYEYKVVPAPTKGKKAKGVKGAEARFSYAIQELMNGLAGYGWEYQRAETLPSIERSGLTSTTTEWRNVLVFRRLRENDAEAFAPELLPAPEAAAIAPAASDDQDPAAQEPTASKETPVSAETVQETPTSDPEPSDTAAPDAEPPKAKDAGDETVELDEASVDNGVEDTSDVKGVGATLTSLAAARKSEKTGA